MANLRRSSNGRDLGDNDIAQLVYDAVVIALMVALAAHAYVKLEKLGQAELPPFTVPVSEKLSSSQAKMTEKNCDLYFVT